MATVIETTHSTNKVVLFDRRNTRQRSHNSCGQLETVCGHSLHKSIIFVSVTSLMTSICTFFSSIVSLLWMGINQDTDFNMNYCKAANLILTMVFSPMSFYQTIISLLLLWQAVKMKGNKFLCSLWFTSHLSILVVYGVLFLLKAVACCFYHKFLVGFISIIAWIGYETLFIFFLIIVHSYKVALDKEEYV